MRRLGGAIAALLLASCGGAGEARLSLPLKAPDGADPLVADFVEICSDAIGRGLGAAGEASKRGWTAGPDAVLMAAQGMATFEKDDNRTQLQIYEINYPHLHVRTCMAMRFDGDISADASIIGKVEGLKGSFQTIGPPGEGGSRGLWSFIGPDGNVVTANVTVVPHRLLQMQMATSKRVAPKAGE